jgi:hypothetical protein
MHPDNKRTLMEASVKESFFIFEIFVFLCVERHKLPLPCSARLRNCTPPGQNPDFYCRSRLTFA